MVTLFSHRNELHKYILTMIGHPLTLDVHRSSILVILTTCVIFSWISVRIYAIPPNYRRYDPREYEDRLRGIRRLLLLVALIVSMEPVRVLVEIGSDGMFVLEDTWRALTERSGEGYSSWWGTFLTTNIVLQWVQFLLAVLTAIAFWKKRRIFRLLAVTYLLLLPVIYGIYDVFLTQILDARHMVVRENLEKVFVWLQVAILGIPFVLISRRINATFAT